MKREIIIGLIVITVFCSIWFFFFAKQPKHDALMVTLVPVRQGQFTASALARGKIVARRKEIIVSPITGIVFDSEIMPGQFLRKGTTIASVQLSKHFLLQKRQEYEFTQLDLEVLIEQLQNQEELLLAKAVSQREVKELRIRKFKTEKQVQNLKEQLELRPVKNSLTGILVEKRIHNRDIVTAGAVLGTIVDTSSFAVDISVPQHIMSQVYLRQTVLFSSELINGVREGTVIEMARVASEQNQNYGSGNGASPEFSVLAAIRNNSKDKLLVGSEVDARFVLAEKTDAVFVPLEALLYRNNTTVVMLAHNSKATQQSVTTGLTNDHFIEIISGLTPGDTVITTGILDINPGDKIQDLQYGSKQDQLHFSRRVPLFIP